MAKRMISTDVTEEDYRTEPGLVHRSSQIISDRKRQKNNAENIYRGGKAAA